MRTLWLILLFMIRAPLAKGICPELLAQLGYSDSFHSQAIFRAAADLVLKERVARKARVPKLFDENPSDFNEGDALIEAFADKNQAKVHLGSSEKPIKLKSEGFDRNAVAAEVVSLEIPQGKKYFRSLNSAGGMGGRKARRTIAASVLNQALSLKTVPKSVWATVNGTKGSLSDAAPGAALLGTLKDVQSKGKVNNEALSNAIAFEFLVGNSDGVPRNMTVDDEGRVWIFDHDMAFDSALINIHGNYPKEAEMGAILPEKYTASFLAALRELEPKKLKRKVAFLLSEEEIEGVLLRRDIILKDAELRGKAAIW